MAGRVLGLRVHVSVPKGQKDLGWGLIRGTGIPEGASVRISTELAPEKRRLNFLSDAMFRTLYEGEEFKLEWMSSTIEGFKNKLASRLKNIFKSNVRNHMGDRGPWRAVSRPRIWRRQAFKKFGKKVNVVGGLNNPMSIYSRGIFRDIDNLKVEHKVDKTGNKKTFRFAARLIPRSKSPDFEQMHSGFSPTEAHVLQYGMVIHPNVLETRSGKKFVIPIGSQGAQVYCHAYLTSKTGVGRFSKKYVSGGIPVIFVNSGELVVDGHGIPARPFMHVSGNINYLASNLVNDFLNSKGASKESPNLDADIRRNKMRRIVR